MHDAIMATRRKKNSRANASGKSFAVYKDKYRAIAKRMCAQGATNYDLADRFGVHVSTIRDWQRRHPRFDKACKEGWGDVDNRVEQSLYERAIGYTYEGEKVIVSKGEVIRLPVKVHVPPDRRAAELWLRNRRPDRWKDTKQLSQAQDVEQKGQLGAWFKQFDGTAMRPKPREVVRQLDAKGEDGTD